MTTGEQTLWTVWVESDTQLFDDFNPVHPAAMGIELWHAFEPDGSRNDTLIVRASVEQATALRDVDGVWRVVATGPHELAAAIDEMPG